MALITGFGGTLTFSGQSTVAVRSFTMNIEKASLDVTTLSDFREKRLPGRVRRSGTLTLYRQDGTIDDTLRAHLLPADVAGTVAATLTLYRQDGTIDNTLRAHLLPADVAGTVAATLTLKYVDQGAQSYDEFGAGTAAFNIHITSASFTDDGTGPAMWELSWEEQ